MNLFSLFSQFLLSQKNPASDATVKNYLADIRKFIRWFEIEFKRTFSPTFLTSQVIQHYRAKAAIAPRSLERSLSTLRKFSSFLLSENLLSEDPFAVIKATAQKVEADPWRLQDFKNYLYNAKSSYLTIKNYIIDLRQFLSWLESVAENTKHWKVKSLTVSFAAITPTVIEEYKNRLLFVHELSPVSINRKLSSLRRYCSFAVSAGYLKSLPQVSSVDDLSTNTQSTARAEAKPLVSLPEAQAATLAVTESRRASLAVDVRLGSICLVARRAESRRESRRASLVLADEDQTVPDPIKRSYSRFPPLRLIQKVMVASNLVFDAMLIAPLAKATAEMQLLVWIAQGGKLFTRVTPPVKHAAKLVKKRIGDPFLPVKNVKKEFYAPLAISLAHLPFHKRVIHHVRYTRPEWYKRYHTYPIAHYFHFAVLMLVMGAIGVALYRGFITDPSRGNFAIAASTPLRVLSFQGRLTDASDNPITSKRQLRFIIYNSLTATSSARLWEEVRPVTPDSDGVFSTLLASNGSGGNAVLCNSGIPPTSPASGACGIPQSLFRDNAGLWLGISVGTDAELSPRQQLATVSYATNAEVLQGLPPTTDGDVNTNTNVVLALNSSGNLIIPGTAQTTFQASSGNLKLTGQALILTTNVGSAGNLILDPDGSGKVDIRRGLVNNTLTNAITTAAGAVEVDDLFAILATSSGQSAFTVNQNGAGPIISASVSGTAKFTVDNNGAGTFADDLAVNGDAVTSSQTTFSLLNSTISTLSFAQAATAMTIGATTGTITVRNPTLTVGGGSATTLQTTDASLTFNTGTANLLQIATDDDFIPSGTSGTNDLGSSSIPWDNIYANAYFAGSTAGQTVTTASCLTTSGGIVTGSGSCSQGSASNWTVANGAIFPNNAAVLDLLLGSTATSSSKFAFINVNSGTPTASISSNLALAVPTGNAPAATLDILNNGTLNIRNSPGGDAGVTSRMFFANNGNVRIGDALTTQNKFAVGQEDTSNSSIVDIASISHTSTTAYAAGIGTGFAFRIGDIAGGGSFVSGRIISLVTDATSGSQNTAMAFYTNVDSAVPTERMRIDGSGNVGIGTTAPIGRLHTEGDVGFVALAKINQLGTQANNDIFTASAAGTTRFVIKNDGNVGINTATPSSQLQLMATADTNYSFLSFKGIDPNLNQTENGRIRFLEPGSSASFLGAFIHYNGDANVLNLGVHNTSDVLTSNDTNAISIKRADGNVGIGTTAPDGKLHVFTASAGTVTANTSADELTIENSTDGGLSILTPAANVGWIMFGSPTSNVRGAISYSHASDFMRFDTAGAEKMRIDTNGNVGIGTQSARYRFHVSDTRSATASATIENLAANATACATGGQCHTGLIIKMGAEGSATDTDANDVFINFLRGDGRRKGQIIGASTGVVYQTGQADFAEYFKKEQANEKIDFGEIVCIGQSGGVKACSEKSTQILGAVSDWPAFVGKSEYANDPAYVIVGLVGQLRVKVSEENGPITPGTYLGASMQSGVAAKAIKPGIVIGRVIESYDANGDGKVLIAVQPGWHDPDVYITDAGNLNILQKSGTEYEITKDGQRVDRIGAFEEAVIGTIQAGYIHAQALTVAGVVNAAQVSAESVTIAGMSLKDYIVTIVNEVAAATFGKGQTANADNFVSPIVDAERVKTNLVSPLSGDTVSVEGNLSVGETENTSDTIALQVSGSASVSGKLSTKALATDEASVSGTLRANRIIADDLELSDEALNKLQGRLNQNATPSATSSAPPTPSPVIASDSNGHPRESEDQILSQAENDSNNGVVTDSANPVTSTLPPGASLLSPLFQTEYTNLASISGQLSYIPNLQADFATFQQGLMSFGPASFADVSVAGQLSVNGNFILSDNSINVLGADLEIQPLRQGDVSFMSGLILIDSEGNLKVSGNAYFAKDVTVRGVLSANILSPIPDSDLVVQLRGTTQNQTQNYSNNQSSSLVVKNASGSGVLAINDLGDLVASGSGKFNQLIAGSIQVVRGVQADTSITQTVASGSAGTAIISRNQLERTVLSPFVKADSLIYITPTSNTNNVTPYIARQTAEGSTDTFEQAQKGSFTIQVPQRVVTDIKVNWWIVN